jgi:hypothetical protein
VQADQLAVELKAPRPRTPRDETSHEFNERAHHSSYSLAEDASKTTP